MKKLTALLIIGSISAIVFFSSTSQQAYAGGKGPWYRLYEQQQLANAHKKVIPHGTTPPPPPPPCNIDKYHHCSAPIVVCFSVRSLLTNAGITPSVITQTLKVLNCS